MRKATIILHIILSILANTGFCQFHNTYGNLRGLGHRFTNGNIRDISMAGATIANHRAQYVPISNPALLGDNKIKFIVSSQFNPQDAQQLLDFNYQLGLNFKNISLSFNRLPVSSYDFQATVNSRDFTGNISSSGSLRENSIGAGFSIRRFHLSANEGATNKSVRLTTKGKKYIPFTKIPFPLLLKDINIGLNAGIVEGLLENDNLFVFRSIGVGANTYSINIDEERRINPIFFFAPGALVRFRINSIFLQLGGKYQYYIPSSNYDVSTTFSDDITSDNQEAISGLLLNETRENENGRLKLPAYYTVGLSIGNFFNPAIQWVGEVNYTNQDWTKFEDFSTNESLISSESWSAGGELRTKFMVFRAGLRTSEVALTSEEEGRTWEFTGGVSKTIFDRILIETAIVRSTEEYAIEAGLVPIKSWRLVFGVSVLSAWFVPRKNMTF